MLPSLKVQRAIRRSELVSLFDLLEEFACDHDRDAGFVGIWPISAMLPLLPFSQEGHGLCVVVSGCGWNIFIALFTGTTSDKMPLPDKGRIGKQMRPH